MPRTYLPSALLLLALAAAGCGVHAAEPKRPKQPKSKFVAHVVFTRRDAPPDYTKAKLKIIGDVFLGHLQMCLSPNVQVAYPAAGEVDFSVGTDDRKEAQRLIDELISRGKRPVRMSFQWIATCPDYVGLMGKDADPRISIPVGWQTENDAPFADEKHRKIIIDDTVVGEWVPVSRGIAYDLTRTAHRRDKTSNEMQVLVLNSPWDLSDLDIVKYWDQGTEIGIKFSPDGAKRLKELTTNQERLMAVVVDGRVDDISRLGPVIETGLIGLYSKVRTPTTERLATYLKGVTNPSPFQFVRSYIEGE
jgi:hypothetical protein